MADRLQKLAKSIDKIGAKTVDLMRKTRRPVTFAASRLFIRLHINQSHITLGRILLLTGLYFAWINFALYIALGLMLSAWILDCVDGDLSRMLHHDNALGEFEDVFADNFACLIFPLILIETGRVYGVLGALFIFASYAVMWMARTKQTQDRGLPGLVFVPKGDIFLSLSRKVIWVLMYLFILFRLDIFNPAYAILTTVLSLSSISSYYNIIRSRLMTR
jgi:phosphatidylglycerophosphate synthase